MNKDLKAWGAVGVLGLALLWLTPAQARAAGGAAPPTISHVLLLSVDGLHAVDFANCSTGVSGVNGGNPYCPNLAGLQGVNYVASSASKPSDSFPGLMALVTGGSPRTMGVYYDVAYDRSFFPPQRTSGNGNPGGSCSPGATPPGTTTEYDEGISFNKNLLNGGAPTGDGGVASIN